MAVDVPPKGNRFAGTGEFGCRGAAFTPKMPLLFATYGIYRDLSGKKKYYFDPAFDRKAEESGGEEGKGRSADLCWILSEIIKG